MARMGGHEGGAPHPGLSAQLCSSVVVAGCTCQPTSQERVRVWGGGVGSWIDGTVCGQKSSGGGNVDTARLVSRLFETKSLSFMAK